MGGKVPVGTGVVTPGTVALVGAAAMAGKAMAAIAAATMGAMSAVIPVAGTLAVVAALAVATRAAAATKAVAVAVALAAVAVKGTRLICGPEAAADIRGGAEALGFAHGPRSVLRRAVGRPGGASGRVRPPNHRPGARRTREALKRSFAPSKPLPDCYRLPIAVAH